MNEVKNDIYDKASLKLFDVYFHLSPINQIPFINYYLPRSGFNWRNNQFDAKTKYLQFNKLLLYFASQ